VRGSSDGSGCPKANESEVQSECMIIIRVDSVRAVVVHVVVGAIIRPPPGWPPLSYRQVRGIRPIWCCDEEGSDTTVRSRFGRHIPLQHRLRRRAAGRINIRNETGPEPPGAGLVVAPLELADRAVGCARLSSLDGR
jgi:hypothetical protein